MNRTPNDDSKKDALKQLPADEARDLEAMLKGFQPREARLDIESAIETQPKVARSMNAWLLVGTWASGAIAGALIMSFLLGRSPNETMDSTVENTVGSSSFEAVAPNEHTAASDLNLETPQNREDVELALRVNRISDSVRNDSHRLTASSHFSHVVRIERPRSDFDANVPMIDPPRKSKPTRHQQLRDALESLDGVF